MQEMQQSCPRFKFKAQHSPAVREALGHTSSPVNPEGGVLRGMRSYREIPVGSLILHCVLSESRVFLGAESPRPQVSH